MSTKIAWLETKAELEDCFRKWGVRDWRLTWSQRGGTDGYGDKERRRVTVEYIHPGGQTVTLSIDEHARPMDNLRVLYLAIDALRLNEARGIGEVLREAYLQLAAPARGRDPWEVLGLRSDAEKEDIEAMYRAKAKRLHPDAGGSEEAFRELQAAYEQAKGEGE
jgi:hypothetical protein